MPIEGVTIKSSRDGGLNWKTETPVPQIFDARFGNFPVAIEGPFTTNDRVQIIIDNNICKHSCTLEKILLKGYFNGMKVKATLEVFNNENLIKTNTIDFSSEWYSIPLNVSFYYNYKIYLTLEITEVTNTNGTFYFYKMIGLGKINNATSTMAKTGLLYEYDKNQNATFPAQIKATEFVEGGTSLQNKYAAKADAVPSSRKINNKNLSSDIVLTSSDVNADPAGSASEALATAKEYSDKIKNDLLNGAGAAYDTLKELGELIDENHNAIEALETIASGKADISTVPTNWINGSNQGALRTSTAKDETDTYTLGPYAIAEGYETSATNSAAHAEGFRTIAEGEGAHSEGTNTFAIGQSSHAEGIYSQANGISSHAEGHSTKAEGNYSHAEGESTQANLDGSHAEGYATQSNGGYSHAEGFSTQSNGIGAHAEGDSSYANGYASHAEGQSHSFGQYSHAEGQHDSIYIQLTGAANSKEYTISAMEVTIPIASGMHLSLPRKNKFNIPIVMGSLTSVTLSETLSDTDLTNEIVYVEMNGAYGKCSHVEGTGTIAFGYDQHVEGQYNVPDSAEIPKYIHIAGNGTKTEPSNAYTLDWTGIGWFARDIYIGGTAYDDETAKKVATENYVNSQFNQIGAIPASSINQICGQ